LAALEALKEPARSQPDLLKFGDIIATLNQLIMETRQLLGPAETCDKCGDAVPSVIGCPRGAEVCQDCFDAAQD
jgi:hypothetical protein